MSALPNLLLTAKSHRRNELFGEAINSLNAAMDVALYSMMLSIEHPTVKSIQEQRQQCFRDLRRKAA